MATDISTTISRPRHPALGAAYGLHLGLLLVAAAAVISRQPAGMGVRGAATLVLVGVALLVWALAERRRTGASAGLRAATAVGAALLLGGAHTPRLAPYLHLPAEGPYGHLPLTLGTVGALLALVCWLIILAGGAGKHFRPAPLTRAVLLGAVLVVALSVLYYLVLRPLYGVSAEDLGTWPLLVRTVQMAALLIPVLGATGGPRVKRWPALYFGAALLLAAATGMLHGGGGAP
jgi:hypothetical protein